MNIPKLRHCYNAFSLLKWRCTALAVLFLSLAGYANCPFIELLCSMYRNL